MQIQENITNKTFWIIDGNSTRSLEMRWKNADLVLYFNFNKIICLLRLLKRSLLKDRRIDDRAENCPEILRFQLIKYMWTFENRVQQTLAELKKKYPSVKFIEINSNKDLQKVQVMVSQSLL